MACDSSGTALAATGAARSRDSNSNAGSATGGVAAAGSCAGSLASAAKSNSSPLAAVSAAGSTMIACGSTRGAASCTGAASTGAAASRTGMSSMTGMDAATGAASGAGSSAEGCASATTGAGAAGASWSLFSASASRAISAPSMAAAEFSCSSETQRENDSRASSMNAQSGALAGFSSFSHLFSTCSHCHATSPRSMRPTMRPLPFSVWKPRRIVVSDSRSCGEWPSVSRLDAIVATTSLASSRKISRSSLSTSAPGASTSWTICAVGVSGALSGASSRIALKTPVCCGLTASWIACSAASLCLVTAESETTAASRFRSSTARSSLSRVASAGWSFQSS